MDNNLYQVAVNTQFNESSLTYQSQDHYEIGDLVSVPLGKRFLSGCIIEKVSKAPSDLDLTKLKPIKEKSFQFKLRKNHLSFLSWTANYYHYPVGKLISDVLPKPMKRPRKLSGLQSCGEINTVPLNNEQQIIEEKITKHLGEYKRWLLHGVTGSGKSNIYLSLIQKVLTSGKSVLFMLPEINLTPQFIKVFQDHVSSEIFIYNSSISGSDKFGLWERLSNENDDPCVVIGVRSAIFLPFKNLGVIIVDEEHDSSFKQDDRCPYNARDIATKRAMDLEIPVILGSATPSVETYSQIKQTEQYLPLYKRALSSELPIVILSDLREKDEGEAAVWPFKIETLKKITEALERNEQVLVFLNKLGFADFLQCRACGHHFSCPNCSSNLKFYKKRNEISCQICGYKDRSPEICPSCSSMTIKQVGYGTEKLTSVLREYFSKHTTERFDRDELTTFTQIENRLQEFHAGKIDILVGTQMLSKGHNFKRVNLVVVMGVDAQLNFPDFRATERAYQLITQVCGRPGRFGEKSEVIIQTMNQGNPVFKMIQEHGFDEFYQSEIPLRKICDCPPFAKIAMIYLTGKNSAMVKESANSLGEMIEVLISKHFAQVSLLGPRPALIEKRVNKYTWSLMLKSDDVNQLHNILRTIKKNMKLNGQVSLKIDIDPYQLA